MHEDGWWYKEIKAMKMIWVSWEFKWRSDGGRPNLLEWRGQWWSDLGFKECVHMNANVYVWMPKCMNANMYVWMPRHMNANVYV